MMNESLLRPARERYPEPINDAQPWKGDEDNLIADKQYCADPDYVLREIAGEYILIPTGSAAYAFNGLAALNETGRFLWQLLSRPCTAAELAGALAREYDLTEAQSKSDVHDFLELAISRGLVSTPADQASV